MIYYERPLMWRLLFLGIVVGYCLLYAPFGVNETDGGFITGLAWQVLSGKMLYLDIVYVRPPLPIWLRALELQWLPEHLAVLGERSIFYVKIALYSWLGAAVLARGERRWWLAILGFVVSAHSYPPMAWHSVDGILFAVLAAYFVHRKSNWALCLGGAFLLLALLCKQSFYPLLPLFILFLGLEKGRPWARLSWFSAGFLLCTALFFNYLYQNGSLGAFWQMTRGAASGGQAFQHGILDYFRISPELAIPSLLVLATLVIWNRNAKHPRRSLAIWLCWLLALIGSFAVMAWIRQVHTAPFAQTRMLFWVALGLFLFRSVPFFNAKAAFYPQRSAFLLLGISWCAAVSWGYSLPILFATPWIWAAMEWTQILEALANLTSRLKPYRVALLLALLISFRVGHEFVYRDGRRSDMQTELGSIFPQLSGVYSDETSAMLYRDLKQLAERYGPNFTVLPAFPQANFLTKTPPPLPLDWVVNRETNRDNNLIYSALENKKPIIFIQKSFQSSLETDPELEVTRQVFQQFTLVEETPHFWVMRP